MRLAVHLWNMARIRKQMKKSITSSSAKSSETQGHRLPEGFDRRKHESWRTRTGKNRLA